MRHEIALKRVISLTFLESITFWISFGPVGPTVFGTIYTTDKHASCISVSSEVSKMMDEGSGYIPLTLDFMCNDVNKVSCQMSFQSNLFSRSMILINNNDIDSKCSFGMMKFFIV